MKKRTPDNLNLFDYEDNLLHALSESNSRHIAEFSRHMTIPATPAGKETPKFKVGDTVANTERSTFKVGMQWKVLEIYKENGFMRYKCQWIPTEPIKKKCPVTIAVFRQTDIAALRLK